MLTNQYILFKDNASEVDISTFLNNFRSGEYVLPIVASEDALYIGSDLPFNHRYFDISTANDEASEITIELWDGSDWQEVNSFIDGTAVSGKTFSQSGKIEWVPDRLKSWSRELDSEDITGITKNIYNMYWVKITFSADLNVLTAVKYIGHVFSDDETLFDFFPDLNSSALLNAFESGKTNWNEQHYSAAEAIIRDLRSSGIIQSANQILKSVTFETASVYKTAELIFQGLGNSYRDDRDDARDLYNRAMKLTYFDVDTNENANLDEAEKTESMRFFTR